MTKTITMYQCELCARYYETNEEAVSCEENGKELPLASVGDLLDYEIEVGGGFDNIFVDLRISEIEDTGHFLIYHFDQEYNEGYGSPYSEYGNESFSRRTKPKQKKDSANANR